MSEKLTGKTCSKCGRANPGCGFYSRNRCKDCRKEYHRNYNQTTECKAYRKARQQTPEYKAYLKARKLAKYGHTPDSWNEVIKAQSNRCGCCGTKMDDRSTRTNKAARPDHCHDTGMFRSAICDTCNKAEGQIRDREHYLALGRYMFGEDIRQLSLFGKS